MQSHRSPRSAAPVGKAAGQAGLDQLIKETGEVAQVLADPNSKASVEHWLDMLRPLVVRSSLSASCLQRPLRWRARHLPSLTHATRRSQTGRDAFELPEDIGAVFVKVCRQLAAAAGRACR